MGKSCASKGLMGMRDNPKGRKKYASGGDVSEREQDYRNALNYEMHDMGDVVGNAPMPKRQPMVNRISPGPMIGNGVGNSAPKQKPPAMFRRFSSGPMQNRSRSLPNANGE